MNKLIIVLSFFLSILATSVQAHSGRTDLYGCHNNRKTGGHHCHEPKRIPRSVNNSYKSPYIPQTEWVIFPNSIYRSNPYQWNSKKNGID